MCCCISFCSFVISTSCSSTNGGPSAMSSLLVPGRMRRAAPLSRWAAPSSLPSSSYSDTPGDVGIVWSSAMGGGLGSRGEDEGDTTAAAMFAIDANGDLDCWSVLLRPTLVSCLSSISPQIHGCFIQNDRLVKRRSTSFVVFPCVVVWRTLFELRFWSSPSRATVLRRRLRGRFSETCSLFHFIIHFTDINHNIFIKLETILLAQWTRTMMFRPCWSLPMKPRIQSKQALLLRWQT